MSKMIVLFFLSILFSLSLFMIYLALDHFVLFNDSVSSDSSKNQRVYKLIYKNSIFNEEFKKQKIRIANCKSNDCILQIIHQIDLHTRVEPAPEAKLTVSYQKKCMIFRLNSFFSSKQFGSSILKEVYSTIKSQKSSLNVVLDIRKNSGGFSLMSLGLSSMFIDKVVHLDIGKKNTVVGTLSLYLGQPSMIYKNGAKSKMIFDVNFANSDSGKIISKKIFIVVDENTASAAEEFAFIMKKYVEKSQVIIVGNSPTFGVANSGVSAFQVDDFQFHLSTSRFPNFPDRVFPDISEAEFTKQTGVILGKPQP
jgi:hypothetical protein